MSKERLHYIDVIKGLLILLVVFGHTDWQANVVGLSNRLINNTIGCANFIFQPFYMSAFFTVTGFCTNFDKPYKKFLFNDIRTLLFPSISLCFVAAIIRFFMMSEWDLTWIRPDRIIRFCSLHWFLPALFWAKQIHYFLHKLKSAYIFIIYFMLAFAGFKLYSFMPEYWWINHALMFLIYIQLGVAIKNIKFKHGWICIFSYLLYVTVMKILFNHIPYITAETHLRIYEMPLFMISSIVGTLAIFFISKTINTCRFLEYCGRNSIVIYCLHFTLMNDFYRLFAESLNKCNAFQTIFSLLLMYGMIIAICSFVAWSLQFKYTKWIIGK